MNYKLLAKSLAYVLAGITCFALLAGLSYLLLFKLPIYTYPVVVFTIIISMVTYAIYTSLKFTANDEKRQTRQVRNNIIQEMFKTNR